jgi:hypothetical protein
MSQYYAVFAVIIGLGLINFVSLFWVMSLQKKLKQAETKSIDTTTAPKQQAHTIMVAEELLRLENVAKDDISKVLVEVTRSFQDDLSKTSKKVNNKVEELTDKVIADELTKYQSAFTELRQASIETLSRIQATIEEESLKRSADVAVMVEAEKKKVIESFEKKMGDIVSGYLVEVLGTNVDLGAQRGYLFATLEAHKDELKKAIAGGP